VSNFVHASDDECLSLVALLAFECAAFDALCAHRLDQFDRSLPAARRASCHCAQWGRSRGMHVVSFRFGGLCVSLESTSAARTSYDGVSIVLQPGRIDRSSLSNMEHFSNNKTRPSTGFLMPLDLEFFRNTTRLAREREVLECSSEQNWRTADNDHFCSALGTCRRGFFGWHFFASHVISFHARLLGASLIGEGSPIRRGLRPE
jgi:hypothetical protein